VKIFVTGCAGFIGSNLVDRLLYDGYEVVGYDNLSTGNMRFLELAVNNPRFTFVNGDLLDFERLSLYLRDIDFVYHLAANADVRFGPNNTRRDLEQNTIATYNVLEVMRLNNIKNIVFSSTGSVYGEAKIIPTPENCSFPVQTSLYGASKSACEGLLQAFSESFDFNVWIFRFVSILGERYTHGHIFDFYKSLKEDPSTLRILGNGKQRKSYLYIQDCIDAILLAILQPSAKVNIYNLGVDDYCEVNDSISWICKELRVEPKLSYAGGDRGWIGDNPFIYLDTKKIQSLGWSPKLTINDGVIKTVRYLQENEWLTNFR